MNTNEMLCVGIDLGTTNTVLAITNKKLNGEVTSKVIELTACGRIVQFNWI